MPTFNALNMKGTQVCKPQTTYNCSNNKKKYKYCGLSLFYMEPFFVVVEDEWRQETDMEQGEASCTN